MPIKLSIIIVSWNTATLLRYCLDSVMSNVKCLMLNVEIIVVDNGSVDGSPEMVRKEFPEVELIENKENLGFAKGNNIGIKEAKGEYIMLLNSDTVVKKGAIEKLIKFLDGNVQAAGVMPLLLNENGSVQKDPIFLRFPSSLRAFFYYNPWLKKIALNLFPDLLFSLNNFRQVTEVEQLSGAAMMLRADIFNSIGGLDERYPHYFEDVDLSFRLKKLGYKLFMDPGAEIVHFGGQSTRQLVEKDDPEKVYFLNFCSLFLFTDKNYPKMKSMMIKSIVLAQLILGGKLRLARKLLDKN